jgi:hypothetical protein
MFRPFESDRPRQSLIGLVFLGWSPTLVFFPHGGYFAEVFRPTLRGFFPALCSQRGRWGLLQEIVSEMDSSGEEFMRPL